MKTILLITPERKTITPEELPSLNNKNYYLQVFDPLLIEFLDNLSKAILKNRNLNRLAAIASLGFWLRKANVQLIIKENENLLTSQRLVLNPIGVVLHICPANVDTMFLYSLALSLLTGNKNIVRVSSKIENNEIFILFDIINELINSEKFNILKGYLNIVQYEHDDDINKFLSINVNARIIWGGDSTVSLFKTFPTASRNKDIAFPDRTSYSIFSATDYLSLDDYKKTEVIKSFYNDSYIFDQKGCSSPQIIFILGNSEDFKSFKDQLYKQLKEYADVNYQNDIYSLATYKFNYLSTDILDNKLNIKNILKEDNYLYFIEIQNNEGEINSCGGGYFYIKHIELIKELEPFINNHIQTLSYFGLGKSDIDEIKYLSFGKGIDRIVPIGESLNFEYIWDGYNLIDELCIKKRVK